MAAVHHEFTAMIEGLADSHLFLLTLLAVLAYTTRTFWVSLYLRLLVQYTLRYRRVKILKDKPVDDSILNDSQRDIYDEVNFMCANATSRSYIHVEITRKGGRKNYVKLTLQVEGERYTLPGQVVTYNCPCNSFSSAGLRLTSLEEGGGWRVSYSGPLTTCEPDEKILKQVKFVLLWKVQSYLIESANNTLTFNSLFDFVCDLYKSGRSIANIYGELKDYMVEGEQTTLQVGSFHGFVQVEGKDQSELILRGFKRRSFGELKREDMNMSCVESVSVSQDGHYMYSRAPLVHLHLSVDLSKVSCVKMYPCGEIVYPHQSNRKLFSLACDSLENSADTRADKKANTYILTDGERSNRTSVLYLMDKRQHRNVDVMFGEGLVLYTNVILEEDRMHQCFLYKDLLPYKESLTRPLLQTLDEQAPVEGVNLLISLDHPQCKNIRLVGGKGSQLAVLYQADLQQQCQVPKAMCLTVEAFHLQLRSNPKLLELSEQLELSTHADSNQLQTLCSQLKEKITSSEMNERTADAIRSFFTKEFNEESRLAVRSSAVGEDGDEQSAAGQMETILGVKGYRQLTDAVLKCWSSHFAFTALEYKRQHGQQINTGMGVVIQEMVNAHQAGALFTYDPVSGSCDTMVINSNHGVGESVVSGESEPDTFHVTRGYDGSFEIKDRKVGSKKIQYVVSDSGDVNRVCMEESSILSINDDVVVSLCKIGLELEQGFGHACDIEWAVVDGQIYLLQSRPITTLDLESEFELLHEFDSPTVIDNEMLSTMNIGEVIPEAVCPLTVSAILPRMEHGLQCFFAMMGLSLSSHNMLALKTCCNRLFIDVHTMEVAYKGRSLIANRRMMELALAGHTIDEMTDDVVESFHPPVSFPHRIHNSLKFGYSLWTGLKTCMSHSDAVEQLSTPDTTDCMQIMYYIESALDMFMKVFRDDMPAASQCAVFSQTIMSILTKGAEVWETRHFSDLALLLGCQLSVIESVGVPEKLEELASLIRETDLAEQFCNLPAVKGHDLLTAADTQDNVRSAYLNFLEAFGHRGVSELDMMCKSWSQDPSVLVDTLQMMVRNDHTEHVVRSSSTSVDDVISKLQSELTKVTRWVISYLLPKTKRAVNNREVCKSLLVKSAYKVKVAYCRLAELMHSQGYLPSEELLFFLTHQEIYRVLSTRNGSLINKAKRRMRVFDKQKSFKFARFSQGIPKPLTVASEDREVLVQLKGMPVSVGQVISTARVVRSLSEAYTIQKNDIMIVQYTDVGWAPFFPLVSGVVTEQGGLVSHGAVVAREYGIPCVASCINATHVFHSGDVVCLDGSAGTVKRLKTS